MRGDHGRSPGGERLDEWETWTDLVDRLRDDPPRRRRVAMLLVVFVVLVFVLVGLVWIGTAA